MERHKCAYPDRDGTGFSQVRVDAKLAVRNEQSYEKFGMATRAGVNDRVLEWVKRNLLRWTSQNTRTDGQDSIQKCF